MPYALFLLGLAALILGAEALVRGAARLALATGLSPLVVGLTVVALGTSAPEIAVGLGAVERQASDIAVGNVIGSNIANVLLVLGLCALLAPLAASRALIRVDVPLMIAASAGVALMARDGRLGRADGLTLAVLAVAYLILRIRMARRAAGGRADGPGQ